MFHVVWLSLFFTSLSLANISEVSFYGARAGAMAGAMAGAQSGTFASYYNPAQLAFDHSSSYEVSWGFTFFKPSFKAINDVVLQNTFNSAVTSGNETSGNVEHDYETTIGQFVSARLLLLPEFKNLSLGFSSFTPFANLGVIDSGQTYIPEYVLYRSRTQRPQFELGLGAQLSENFGIGIGGQMLFQISNETEAFLATSSSKTSSMRIRTTLKPQFSPYVGGYYQVTRRISTGLVVRLPTKSKVENDISIAAEVLGGAGTPHFLFNTASALGYQPLSFELGNKINVTRNWGIAFQVHYERWSLFEIPATQIKNENGATVISDTTQTLAEFKDIWVFKIGQELALSESFLVRAGYSRRPSIIRSLSSENFNYIDPDKNIFTIGAGLDLSKSWTMDLQLAYHALSGGNVTKSDSTSIGAPGYEVGGNLFGGSVSFTLGF